jgi:hypothetical protein
LILPIGFTPWKTLGHHKSTLIPQRAILICHSCERREVLSRISGRRKIPVVMKHSHQPPSHTHEEDLTQTLAPWLKATDARTAGSKAGSLKEEDNSPERTIKRIVETVCAWSQLGIPTEETLVALECHRSPVRSPLPQPLTVKAYIRHCLSEDCPETRVSEACLRKAIRRARFDFDAQANEARMAAR